MTTQHSFVVKFDQLETDDDLKAVRGDLVPDCVMFGDFELTINGVEFGEHSIELLGFVIGLYQAVSHVLSFGGDSFYQFEECDLKLEITDARGADLIVSYVSSAGRWKKVEVNGLEMLRSSARFLTDILDDAFARYPDLLCNHSFLISCPLAMKHAWNNFRDTLDFACMQYYPSADALTENNLAGEEVQRLPKTQ